MSPPKRVSPLLPLATARWRRAVFLKIRIGVSRALFRGWLTLRRHRLCLYFQGLLRLTSSGASRPGACVCTDGEDNFCRRDQYQPALLRRRRDRSPGDEPKRRGQHRRRRKVRGVAEGFLRVTFVLFLHRGRCRLLKRRKILGKIGLNERRRCCQVVWGIPLSGETVFCLPFRYQSRLFVKIIFWQTKKKNYSTSHERKTKRVCRYLDLNRKVF